MEEWKDIKGYEGLYQVSNMGRIKSLKNNKETILKPYRVSTGYYKIDLRKKGVRKIKPIHRLIADAFIDNPDSLTDVNHIDGNKANNTILNLEWTTRADNIKHSYKHKLHVHKPSCKPVQQISIDTGEIIKIYKSINEAARQLGIRHESISACVKGVTSSYGGYKWNVIEIE